MKSFFTIILLILLVSSIAESQYNLDPSKRYMIFGIVEGVNFLNHKTSIPLIPGSNDCGNYENGKALGYYFGIMGGYSIINNLLSVDVRLTYDYRPANFTENSSQFEIYDPNSGGYQTLDIEHMHTSSLTYFSFDFGIKILPFSQIPVYFRFSFDAGNPLFSSNYTNEQLIQSPESALFPSETKQRTIDKGDLNSAGTAMGVSLTLGYEFEINGNFHISPEISYRYGVNSVSSDFDWKTNIIRAGLIAFWAIPISAKARPTKIESKIEKPEKEIIIVEKKSIKSEPAKPVEEPKPIIDKINIDDLNLTKTIVTQTYPLLLYIFFDEGDATLRNKYKSDKSPAQFNENNLPVNTIDIYYQIFDIMGSRLKNNPNAMLTLTGTSDGKERESEKERLILAEQRAKNIKDYLVNRWNINPNIITIKTRDIPELPTSEAYVEGFEENRRVEISSNSPDILAPVIHSKFLEFTSKQESINVNAILNDCDLLAWEFSLTDKNNNEIFKSNRFGRTRGYRGYNFNIKIPVNQIFIDEAGRSISSNDNLHYLFKVTNISNKKESKEGGLKINLATNQYEVGRLNLIVFDFDKSDISTLNKKLINDFIKSSIQKNSIVRITGGTDRLGESTYNKKLSIERAHTARKFLLSIQPDINITEIKGKGASDLKYNNDLPEGRFYCRTVMIEIKTPVK